MTKSIRSKSLSKLFIHKPLMKVFSYERVIYVLFCNSCIFCPLLTSISNQYIAWKLKLYNNIAWDDHQPTKWILFFLMIHLRPFFLFQCCSDKWELQKVKTSQFEDQRVSLCRLSAVSTKDVRSLNNFSFPPTYEFPWV